jgi:hypothetical protein
MALKSLKLTKKEAKEEVAEYTEPTPPEYSYGTRLCLDDETLQKLGITELPKVGTVVTIVAKAEVISRSEYESKRDGKTNDSKSCDLQLTDMEIDTGKAPASDRLYGGKA